MDNIVRAVFGGGRRTKVCPQYKFNKGQQLVFLGVDLPASYEVHFANSESGNSITQIGTSDGVTIPDQFFWSGADTIYAWVYLAGENDGTTKYTVIIPLLNRARPTDIQPSPQEATAVEQAISALNAAEEAIPGAIDDALAAAKASGEFDGPPGADGKPGSVFFTVVHDSTIDGELRIVTITGAPSFADIRAAMADDMLPVCDIKVFEGEEGTIHQMQHHLVLPLVRWHEAAYVAEFGGVDNGHLCVFYYNHATLFGNKWFLRRDAVQQLSVDQELIEDSENPVSGGAVYAEVDGLAGQIGDVNDAIGDLNDLQTTAKTNLVAAINEAAQSGGGGITVDDALSDSSTNPVQNKVIKSALDGKGTYSKPSGGIPDADIASAETWNAKGSYSKPSGGIPKTDLSSGVKTSLEKADSALQSETDPTVPSWAKAPSKPSYSASEVGAVAAPSSPSVGDFMVYTANGWDAVTMSAWQGGSY